MTPDDLVTLPDMDSIRQSVRGYLDDNVGWRAEDRDLAWGYRFVIAKMALLAGQQMQFKELTSLIQETLNETASDLLKYLTPELIAARIIGISPDEIQVNPPVPTIDSSTTPGASQTHTMTADGAAVSLPAPDTESQPEG